MSVPLQSVPENQEDTNDPTGDDAIAHARHEADEIIARARREADSIVANAKAASTPAASPLAALGDNAEEIIGQVRKLIQKQRQLQSERKGMLDEIEALKSERDELVQRLTDAVERMEELARLADMAQSAPTELPPPPRRVVPPPPPLGNTPPEPPALEPPTNDEPAEDTSLAARLRKAEAEESDTDQEDSSLAARLERAERERNARAAAETTEETEAEAHVFDGDGDPRSIGADGRSFYDRHSAKLPRLEGDGGRSVLSAIGDMRPESEPKGRKGRRRNKKS